MRSYDRRQPPNRLNHLSGRILESKSNFAPEASNAIKAWTFFASSFFCQSLPRRNVKLPDDRRDAFLLPKSVTLKVRHLKAPSGAGRHIHVHVKSIGFGHRE